MLGSAPPSDCPEVRCPMCRRYLGSYSVENAYMRLPPCECGWQWTGEAVGKRARRSVETPDGGRIEVKAR